MATKVMIVDDSVSMRQMVEIILKTAGYEVTQAVDGREGLEKLTDDTDVVISDYNMPNMNGVEFISAVRNGLVNRAVPIIMLTTESEDEKKQAGKQAGATAWITKPVNRDNLVGVLRKVTATLDF
ncbi:MAG: response regulator [Spirochaetaceae bacterium]|nr:MAG: response regulator [Spirochaetaceae bacterium]